MQVFMKTCGVKTADFLIYEVVFFLLEFGVQDKFTIHFKMKDME